MIDSLRQELGIPREGFSDESGALAWYRVHFREATGSDLTGGFGYRFDDFRQSIEFDYEFDDKSGRFSVGVIPPIDRRVPLDRAAESLAGDMGIDLVHAPALRPVLLVGSARGPLPQIPMYISAAMGVARLLMHLPSVVSDAMRRRILDETGPFSSGIVQGYLGSRKSQKTTKYWDVLLAYGDWLAMKRDMESEGRRVSRRGYLGWVANRLVRVYGWPAAPATYTVNRYLKRALALWDFPGMDWERE